MPALRILELYCGIGGVSAAVSKCPAARIVAAIDVSTIALDTYRANWDHAHEALNIASIAADHLATLRADLWWLSPPCQPYTSRGKRRDLDDPRAHSLISLLDHISNLEPKYVVLENVLGFATSKSRELIVERLSSCGYGEIRELSLCPSHFGVPNRRPRFYLVASTGALAPTPTLSFTARPLRRYLDPDSDDDPSLRLDVELARKYLGALHIVDRLKPGAITHCFTSAYGRSPVRSGSYLSIRTKNGGNQPDGIRLFSPREILALLHFPDSFELPEDLALRIGWRLVGNSLSILPVQSVLGCIPELRNSGMGHAA